MVDKVQDIINAIGNLQENVSHNKLSACRNALNSLLGDKATCVNFLYTVNYDKLPFGCIVFPRFEENDVNTILISGDNTRLTKYEVELDSKLFDYGMSPEQVTQVVLYNILHLTGDRSPMGRVRECIDIYFTHHETQLVIKDSIQYQAILELGIVDALHQFTNCMCTESYVTEDPYLNSLDLHDFDAVQSILFKEIPGCENSITRQPKLNMLDWALRLYTNVKNERIPAIRLLEKCKKLTGSTLYIQKFNNVLNSLNRIDTDTYIQEAVTGFFNESKKRGSLINQIKYNGLRGLEDDFYEFVVRARNADTEDEVMYALKQINVRLSILDDYLRTENLDDKDRERWQNLYDKYMSIRDEIASKKVYNKRNYGVFVDYNKLDQLDYDNY